jgi:hypothetical protein
LKLREVKIHVVVARGYVSVRIPPRLSYNQRLSGANMRFNIIVNVCAISRVASNVIVIDVYGVAIAIVSVISDVQKQLVA